MNKNIRNGRGKRTLAWLLSLVMVMSMLNIMPLSALADEVDGTAMPSEEITEPVAPPQTIEEPAPQEEQPTPVPVTAVPTPEATAVPEVTETPETTETPEETPVASEEPESSETPEPSEEPDTLAAVQALIDALPSLAEMAKMDAEALAVARAQLRAAYAAYAALDDAQRAQLTGAEALKAIYDVQQMINALPDAEAVAAMDKDAQGEVYMQTQAAYDAYEELNEEQQALIKGIEGIYALFDFFNGQIAMLASPIYAIHNLDEFKQFRDSVNEGHTYSGETVTLMADINLGGEEWTPIGNADLRFKGTFDGGEFTVSGLSINDPSSDTGRDKGLFGATASDTTIKNLNVSGSITAYHCIGGVVAANYGTIEYCSFSGTLNGGEFEVGGIAGYNRDGVVRYCFSDARLSGSERVGGIVGSLHSGAIENCHSTGSVSGSKSIGGIAGSGNGTTRNCYYLDGLGIAGGFNGVDKPGQAERRTSDQFASGEVAWLLQNGQGSQVWGQTVGSGYPELTSDTAKRVWRVTFTESSLSVNQTNYYNNNASLALPGVELASNLSWMDEQTGAQITAGMKVTKDIDAVVGQRTPFGGEGETIGLTYGEGAERNLDAYMAYENGADAAGKFSYDFAEGGNTIGATISGSILTIPASVDVGEHALTITATEKEPLFQTLAATNFGTDPVTLTVTVNVTPKQITPTVELSGDMTYTGKAVTPTVAVKDGDVVIPESEYTAAFSNNINARENTAFVTITDNDGGNYTINETTQSFTISPKPITGASVTISNYDAAYSGAEQTPTVTVTLDGKTLEQGTDYTYTITPAEVKNAGSYAVTVTGTGNYTAAASTTFTIAQATPNVTEWPAIERQVFVGDTLASSDLVGGAADVEGTFTIAETLCSTAGEMTLAVTFTPTDSVNYATVTGAITVQVYQMVDYYDSENGLTKQAVAEAYTSGNFTDAGATGGWYVVNGDVTVSSRISVSGHVNLILADGCTLDAQQGISMYNPENNTSNNSLSIWGQSAEYATNGSLIATGGSNQAGIGSNNSASQWGGFTRIYGGRITAQGGSNGAGIGGGNQGTCRSVYIYGGIVAAQGGGNGAGIGGGNAGDGYGTDIPIYGGTVTATGGGYGAGIGGGKTKNGFVWIHGGTVTATGGYGANGGGAGIGGGGGASSSLAKGNGQVSIYGGTVTATGGSGGSGTKGALGIGRGGYNGSYVGNSSVEITGGTVTATGGNEASYAVGAAPNFGTYVHATYGGSAATTDVVEFTGNPISQWNWHWAKIQPMTVQGLTVAPGAVSMTLNGSDAETVDFEAALNVLVGGSATALDVTDLATWSVDSQSSSTVSGGTLTVDAAERADELTVQAAYEAGSEHTATATVAITQPTCEVTFDANGGAPTPDKQTVSRYQKATEPESVSRAGYAFDGWYTEENVKWDFAENEITGNLTLYAEWTEIMAEAVTLDASEMALTYGGESKALTATVSPADALDKALTWTVIDQAPIVVGRDVVSVLSGVVAPLNAGTATVLVSTANGKTAQCTVTVAPKLVTATVVNPESKTYDGTTEIGGHHGLGIKLDGVVSGDEDYVYGGADVYAFDTPDVGENKTITASGLRLYGPKADCYKYAGDTATGDVGTITPAPLNITVQSFVYNGGAALEIALDGVEVNGAREQVKATLTAFAKDAGEYAYADAAAEGRYTVSLGNGNYTVGAAGTLTIGQLEAELEWHDFENLTYTGRPVNVTATVANLVDGDSCTVTVDGGAQTDAGMYTAKATGLSNGNYELPENVEREYVIGKAPVNFTVSDNDLLFNEEDRTATVTEDESDPAQLPEDGFTVSYRQGDEIITPNGVGEYEIWVTLNDGNYKFADVEEEIREMQVGTLTISNADQDAPQVAIGYVDEVLSTTADMQYCVGDGDWEDCTDAMPVTTFGWDGTSEVAVSFRYAEKTNYNVGAEQDLTIPARPDAPTDKIKVVKTDTEITVQNMDAFKDCEYAILEGRNITADDVIEWLEDGVFTQLSAGTEYTLFVRFLAMDSANWEPIALMSAASDDTEAADDGYFASHAATKITITVDSDGSTTLKPDETVVTDRDTVTNTGNDVTIEDNEGNKTTVTPADSKDIEDGVEVDGDGNVTAPAGSDVQTGDGPTRNLPNGGEVASDGTVTADEIVVGDTTVTGEGTTADNDGNITVPKGGTVTPEGGPEMTLPEGGMVNPDGSVEVPDGGSVEMGDTTVTPPAGGGTIEPNGDGTVDVPGSSTIDPGNGTDIVVGDQGGTVDEDGNVTVPGGGTVKIGDTEFTAPEEGGTFKPNPDGTVDIPGGSTFVEDGEVKQVPESGGVYDPNAGKVIFNTHIVSFNTQGGSAISPMEVAHNTPVSKPNPDPTRSGYDFSSWYTDAACSAGNEYDFSKPVTDELMLYAKWTEMVQPTPEPTAAPTIEPTQEPDGTSPQTGDDSHLKMWATLMILSCLGMGVTCVWNFQTKKKRIKGRR